MKRQQGFTLVELLVVIAIIAFMAAVLSVVITSVRVKSRDTKRVADVQLIQRAMELYFNECGSYPQLPPATTGFILNSTKSLFSGTVNACGNNQGTGTNGGIGTAPHTAGTNEKVFFENFPTAPTPVDNGSLATGNKCGDAETQVTSLWNDYSYYSFTGNSYFLDFCISQQIGSLSAGHHTLTEKGIQ